MLLYVAMMCPCMLCSHVVMYHVMAWDWRTVYCGGVCCSAWHCCALQWSAVMLRCIMSWPGQYTPGYFPSSPNKVLSKVLLSTKPEVLWHGSTLERMRGVQQGTSPVLRLSTGFPQIVLSCTRPEVAWQDRRGLKWQLVQGCVTQFTTTFVFAGLLSWVGASQ
jgi:hypothetical protein